MCWTRAELRKVVALWIFHTSRPAESSHATMSIWALAILKRHEKSLLLLSAAHTFITMIRRYISALEGKLQSLHT